MSLRIITNTRNRYLWWINNSENGSLTHWPLGNLDAILKLQFSILFYWLVSSHRLMIMPSDECHGTSQSKLVKVMAWCRQATSHYLSQCWPSSMSPYGVTRPQWVNCTISGAYRNLETWAKTFLCFDTRDTNILIINFNWLSGIIPSIFLAFWFEPFWCWNRNIRVWLSQCHGCWCPGPLRLYIRAYATYSFSVMNNYRKCIYSFIFPEINSTQQGLIQCIQQ